MSNNSTNNQVQQTKRQFLKSMTLLLGTGASASLLSGAGLARAFQYHAGQETSSGRGRLFNTEQMKILRQVCDVVLPRTDTPSAAELDVHGFIEHQLITCFGEWQQQSAISVLTRIDSVSQQVFGSSFNQFSVEQQTQLLVALENQQQGFTEQDQQQFSQLKSLMVFGFFTTEVGATQALNYQAVPGGFKGSVSYKTLGKSWGSLDYY